MVYPAFKSVNDTLTHPRDLESWWHSQQPEYLLLKHMIIANNAAPDICESEYKRAQEEEIQVSFMDDLIIARIEKCRWFKLRE